LEDQRFSVGRSGVLQVIQAGDDATGAELELAQAQVELRQTSWKIQKSRDQVVPYLEQLEKRYKGIKLQ
jgi:outer membrane protein TolC